MMWDVEHELDNITGIEKLASVEHSLRAQLEGQISDGSLMHEMRSTRGWVLYETFVRSQIDKLKDELVDEKDSTRIVMIQAMVRAYSNCIGGVLSTIAQGDYAREELSIIMGLT